MLAVVPMPEAAVHEDDGLVLWKDDVRGSGKVAGVKTEAQTRGVQVAADSDFGRGILPAHALHQGGSLLQDHEGRLWQ